MSGVLIIGAGGHGKVVADILLLNQVTVIGFLDDNPATWNRQPLGLPVLGFISTYTNYAPDGLVLGIGANHIRKQIVDRLGPTASHLWRSVVHPRAIVARSAQLGCGLVIAAGAVINPGSTIGDYAIINTAATVDHDCLIGPYAHMAPGSHAAGAVRVGTGTLCGTGAALIPNTTVGDWTIIGAGAVVIKDVPDNCTAVGVPTKVLKLHQPGWHLD